MRKRVDPGGVHRESDGFWSKVLVSTIVVIWVSLVAGQWAARWAIEHGKFAAKGGGGQSEMAMDQRPEYQPPVPSPVDTSAAPTDTTSPPAETIEQSAQPEATVTVLPPSDTAAPASDEPPPEAIESSESPDSVTDTPASDDDTPTPEATEATEAPIMPSASPLAATPNAPATGRPYTLQVGVYANRANAEKVADDLRSKGYTVQVEPEASGSESTWAVHVGHFPTHDAASSTQDKLQSDGFSALPVQR